MRKHNLLTKQLKKQFLSLNDSIESYFNKLKFIKSNLKKTKLIRNNKAFLILGTISFLLLTYFLIPNFYNKNLIQSQIENQVLKKYNTSIKINKKIKYGLFPKPHFVIKDSSIFRKDKNIAKIGNLKIYISINNFLRFNQIEVKDLFLKKTDFKINSKDLVFFANLLKTEPNENEIIIKDSKIFYKGNNDDLLFINKIKKYRFYYDSKNLQNILSSSNEIFNTPFKLVIKNDKFNQKLYSQFKAKKFRLSVNNLINYDGEIKNGLLDVLLINKNTSLKYKIKKNSLIFNSNFQNNSFKGKIDFKPFYFFADFNYDGLSSKNLFSDDSIFFDLIKSEIFNNSNLNIDLNLNVKDIVNIDELNNLKFRLRLEEGNIILSDTSINWKNDLQIVLKESLINYNNESINLVGKMFIKFKNSNNFYKSFQVKKNLRKSIDEIQLDINYNFTNNEVSFSNIKIDDNLNINVEKFINKFNSQSKRSFNKITFKNFINKFFAAYSG